MHADEAGRGVAHGVLIERKRIMQHVAPQHGRDDFAAIQTIAINFAAGRPARVEVRADLLGCGDANGGRQKGVQGTLKFARGKRRLRAKAADLAQRVDARVGAPSGVQLHIFLRDPTKHIHDFALHRGLVGLNLPTVEVRTVVRDGELEITHGGEKLSIMRKRESSEAG